MDENERKDLEEMLKKIQARKLRAFDYAEFCLGMDSGMLRNSGHKSIESAVFIAIKDAKNDIKKLTLDHVRKYPD